MSKYWLLVLLISGYVLDVHAQASSVKTDFIEHLLAQMTLEEKAGQLELASFDLERITPRDLERIAEGSVGGIGGGRAPPLGRELQRIAVEQSRLKIPLYFAQDVVHGMYTIFPVSLALAASWDLSAITRVGRVSAQEAGAEGVNLTLSPMVDITRDPRWGRVSEGYGEDAYLASRIAATLVKAYQGEDLRGTNSLMAAVKHFALYGAVEGGRDYNSVDMSTATMYQFYFDPYRAAVDAGAGVVMVAFNTVAGVPAIANPWLIRQVLRHDWGFSGVTLGDCAAIIQLIDHGVAADEGQAAALALRSGLDVALCDDAYVNELPRQIRAGAVSTEALDEAVRHVLGMKYDMGLFDAPYHKLRAEALPPVETRLQRDAARSIARETFVLLKNARQALPLRKHGRIALIGPLAKSQRDLLGSYCGSCDAASVVSIYDGMAQALRGKATLLYARGANASDDGALIARLKNYGTPLNIDPRPPRALLDEARAVARQADVVVAVLGEPWSFNDEASSRSRIDLPSSQKHLLKALWDLGKPLIIVLVNGRPMDLSDEQSQADALLVTWYSGTEGGNAVADVLFGDYNPSGKLPMTFPRSVGQIPLYYNHLNTGRPYDSAKPFKYTTQYIDEAEGPLYPFGYGLSYSQFVLSDLQLSAAVLRPGESLKASVELTNTGEREGETVVQLYIRDPLASVSRPVKELKGFQKVLLKAGERRRIEFNVSEGDLKFYNAQLQHVAEPGEFRVQVGLDSNDVLEQRFELR
ncbi:beta-glucosidase BglX [Pseudomonas sp. LF245]